MTSQAKVSQWHPHMISDPWVPWRHGDDHGSHSLPKFTQNNPPILGNYQRKKQLTQSVIDFSSEILTPIQKTMPNFRCQISFCQICPTHICCIVGWTHPPIVYAVQWSPPRRVGARGWNGKPSRKLTACPLKTDLWKTYIDSFWDGWTWQVRTVSFKECNIVCGCISANLGLDNAWSINRKSSLRMIQCTAINRIYNIYLNFVDFPIWSYANSWHKYV